MQLATTLWQPPATLADGRRALLIHGMSGAAVTWWRVGPALAERGWLVWAVNLPAHGGMPPSARVMDVQGWAADVAETVDEVTRGGGVELAIGHSAGGAALAELAVAEPHLVERVVLEDPAAASGVDPRDRIARLRFECTQARREPIAAAERIRREHPDWVPGDVEATVTCLASCAAEALVPSFERGMGYRTPELLPRIRQPLLLLLGRPDRGSVLRDDVRRLTLDALPPQATRVEMEAGHVLHRDRYDEYVSTVLGWTSGVSATVRG